MQTPTSPPADQPPSARLTIGYALLAAAIGAITATLTTVVGFFVLNPTIFSPYSSARAFQDSLVFLGGPHMLVCGTPACLVGGLAAVPGLLLARRGKRGSALLGVLVAALVVGVIAGIVVQGGVVLLYNFLLPCGPSGQIMSCQ